MLGNEYVPPGRLIYDPEAVRQAVQRQAHALAPKLKGKNPIVLVVMCGALYYAAWLTSELSQPMEIDYVHLSRYGANRTGGTVHWERRPPPERIKGRTVLILDEIYDEGITLTQVRDYCIGSGAIEVLSAVLTKKRIARQSGLIAPDFVALEVPDAFIVGCGLDDAGWWRNLPALYALDKDDSDHG